MADDARREVYSYHGFRNPRSVVGGLFVKMLADPTT
jgi:hypothetical protein